MSKRKPDSDLKNQALAEQEEDAGEGEENEAESNNLNSASEEVMKTRRIVKVKRKNKDSTPHSSEAQNGESVKKEESAPSSYTFGTSTGNTSIFNSSTPFSFGNSSISNSFTFPSIFSFGIPNSNTSNTTTTPSTTSTETSAEKPFSFGFSNPSFGDFKFPSFTSLSSFNTTDADKTREATTNASTTWSTDFSVTDTGDTSSPQSSVKLSKIEKPTTGEEGEKTLSEARVRLYEFEKSAWKERGIGTIKINTDQSKYRILMRTDTTLRVILNATIYNEMTAEEQSEKNLRFSCVNSIVSEDTPEAKISNFLVRFQTKQAFEDFFKAIQAAKVAAGPLKKSSTKDLGKTNNEEKEDNEKPDTKPDKENEKEEEKN